MPAASGIGRGRSATFLVLAAAALLVAGCSDSSTGPPAASTTTSAPLNSAARPTAPPGAASGSPSDTASNDQSAESLRTALDESIDQYVRPGSRQERLIRAVLVSVNGDLLVERYGQSSAADATSNIFSVTKSVMSTLIGIAIDEGRIAGLHATLRDLLPAYAAEMSGEVASITLEQLLTMTGGITGAPDLPGELLRSDDLVRTILTMPLVAEPGATFQYSDGSAHLISAILTAAAGRPALDYAREKLFGPLGIDTEPAAQPLFGAGSHDDLAAYAAEFEGQPGFTWAVDPQGLNTGFSELKITARDMLALGQLFLDEGRHGGTQTVSAEWVQAATDVQVGDRGQPGEAYGYLWWAGEVANHESFAAMGFAGQLVQVVPDLGLVVVVSSVNDVAMLDAPSIATDLVPAIVRAVG